MKWGQHVVLAVFVAGVFSACSLESGALSSGGDGSAMDGAVDSRASDAPQPDARDSSTSDSSTPVDSSTPPADSSTRDSSAPPDAPPPPPDTEPPPCPDRDGDGTCDADDPCPDDPADDSDGDGTCDSDDTCPDGDDRRDEDGDGVPNDCDPCAIDGPRATPIPTSVTNTDITISNVALNGGGNIAIVDGGDSVSVSLDYTIVDCECSGCIDQIEIGLVPAPTYSYCAYSAVPGCSGDAGSDTGTLTAPAASGVYYVRFGRAQNFGCTHADWWQGTPPAARTIGALCVR